MFVSMILDPIWQLYDAAVKDHNGVKAGRMAAKLGLDVPTRELDSPDPRTVLQVRETSGRLNSVMMLCVVDLIALLLVAASCQLLLVEHMQTSRGMFEKRGWGESEPC